MVFPIFLLFGNGKQIVFSLILRFFNVFGGNVKVLLHFFNANEFSVKLDCRNCGCSATKKRIQHHVSFICIQFYDS